MLKETILITGGSGFLGRNLALELRKDFNIVLGSRNNGINYLASDTTGCQVAPMDITSVSSIKDVLQRYNPQHIIHAAATKFVDISEKNPFECIDINIAGTQNVARLAIENGIKSVIGISTDKAASPIGNIYGHSKAIMERLFSGLDTYSDTIFTCVRFGNIAWSTGSVLPLWQRMTTEKMLVETTGLGMRRFMFSINEAVKLVKTSLLHRAMLKGGILSSYMNSVEIKDLLEVWKELHNVDYKQIERRIGDKIDEVLISEFEASSTKEIILDGTPYLLLKFNHHFDNSIKGEISSATASKMSYSSMRSLILNKPEI